MSVLIASDLDSAIELVFCAFLRLDTLMCGHWLLKHLLNEVSIQVFCSFFYRHVFLCIDLWLLFI